MRNKNRKNVGYSIIIITFAFEKEKFNHTIFILI